MHYVGCQQAEDQEADRDDLRSPGEVDSPGQEPQADADGDGDQETEGLFYVKPGAEIEDLSWSGTEYHIHNHPVQVKPVESEYLQVDQTEHRRQTGCRDNKYPGEFLCA